MPESNLRNTWPQIFLVLSTVSTVTLAVVLYQMDWLDPAALPLHEMAGPTAAAPTRNSQMLRGAEFIGEGSLAAPEDLAYDAEAGVIYTGCADGWVKRVTVNDSVTDSLVEDWVNTGGRPLGLVLGRDGKLLVADTEKGLVRISKEGVVELLSDEAEGIKFKLTDCVDEAEDGMIYFTDASHRYSLKEHMFDILEGKPNGRLLSYNPATKQTQVLLRDLYFANGVLVSPDQSFVVFCETIMRRCRKYHLKGEKKASVEAFIEMLPGMPDNIRYDAKGGLYWIALATEPTLSWKLALKYPLIRKGIAILERYGRRPSMESNGGVFAVDLQGKPVYHFHDPSLTMISTGTVIGNHLYCGSVVAPHILRLHLDKYNNLHVPLL